MPSIIVTADTDSTRDDPRAFQLKERVRTSDLDNPHFSSQLVERIGWALADAEEAERAGAAATWQPPTDARPGASRRTPSRVRNE